MIWVAEPALPQASAADQTRCSSYSFAQLTLSCCSANCTVGSAPQSLVAVTPATAGMAAQLTVTSAGTPSSWGAEVSVTVIAWVTTVALPQASVAVQERTSVYWVAQLPGRLSCA